MHPCTQDSLGTERFKLFFPAPLQWHFEWTFRMGSKLSEVGFQNTMKKGGYLKPSQGLQASASMIFKQGQLSASSGVCCCDDFSKQET